MLLLPDVTLPDQICTAAEPTALSKRCLLFVHLCQMLAPIEH